MRAAHLKQVSILVAFVGMVLSASGQDFTGQRVTIGHYLPNDKTVFDGPYPVTVVSGTIDRQLITPFADRHKGYGVNVESDRVIIDFIDSVWFTAGPEFHGVIISNLVAWGWPSITETAPHRILSYGSNVLKLDWQGITVPNKATYTIVFTAKPYLSATRQAGSIILSWSSSATNAVLEASGSFVPDSWASVTNTPILKMSQYFVTNAITPERRFYRLRQN
jgi:hypothetical protein